MRTVNEQQDYEANVFAVCLLMPKDRLLEEMNKMGGLDLVDDKNMKKLCGIFRVTATQLAFRLSILKNEK